MNYQQWYERGLDAPWRQVVAQEIFNLACNTILDEVFGSRTQVVSLEANALHNQFREGAIFAIRNLHALATPHIERKPPLSKPWERKPDDEELPPGPKRAGEQE